MKRLPVETFYFIIDESGAKGYSDNTESMPGELGVMAGYFFPESMLSFVRMKFDAICDKFLGNDKTHITDLNEDQQQELRAAIFDQFKDWNIKWVYEAVYVEGLHHHSEQIARIAAQAKKSRKSSIKVSGNEKRDSLHVELFAGVFVKALAFGTDNFGSSFSIKIITDRIDPPIRRKFETAADHFLRAGEKRTHEVTGFDTKTRRVVKGAITIETSGHHKLFDDLSGVTLSIDDEVSSLTLAADVLCNSVHHHLKSLQLSKTGANLNRRESIVGHALQSQVRYVWEDPDSNYIADAVYMHPEAIIKSEGT